MSCKKRLSPCVKGAQNTSKTPRPCEAANSTSRNLKQTPTSSKPTMSRAEIQPSFYMGARSSKGSASALKNTSFFPAIKSCLTVGTSLETKQLELNLLYNDYLQAQYMERLAKKTVQSHQQDLQDQISIQNDNLEVLKKKHQKVAAKLRDMGAVLEVEEVLNKVLVVNAYKFDEICGNLELRVVLGQLRQVLDVLSKRVYVEGVSCVKVKEDYEKLASLMKKTSVLCKQAVALNKDMVVDVAKEVELLNEKVVEVSCRQANLNESQRSMNDTLLKSLSDFYAKREKYD